MEIYPGVANQKPVRDECSSLKMRIHGNTIEQHRYENWEEALPTNV